MDRRTFLALPVLLLGCGSMLTDARVFELALPRLRFHTSILRDGFIWTFGGEGPSGAPIESRYFVDVHTIDPVSRVTTTEPYLPLPVAHHSTLVLGDKAIHVGGMSAAGGVFVSSSATQITDLTTRQTALGPSMGIGVHDPITVEVGDVGIACGGWAGLYNVAQAFVVSAGALEPFSLQCARTYATAHETNGKALIVGGVYRPDASTLQNLRSVELLDPVAKSSAVFGYLSTTRRYHSSRKVGSSIFVFGGTGENVMGRPPALGSIERIDLATGVAEQVGFLKEPRYHCHSFSVRRDGREYVVLVGGQKGAGVPVYSIEQFDCETGATEIITSMPFVSLDHDRVTCCNANKAYVVGGENLVGAIGTSGVLVLTFPPGSQCYRA